MSQLNVFGEAPIHIAAWKGEVKDLRWLLNHGADLNQRGEFGMTPLHYACMGLRLENVEFLLAAGADRNLRCDAEFLPDEGRLAGSKGASPV